MFNNVEHVRFEVMVVTVLMISWVLAPCGLASRCQHFRQSYSFSIVQS